MPSGGRRRPLGPLFSGPVCCLLVIGVLSLWFGMRVVPADSGHRQIASVSHAVASLAPSAARPLPTDEPAVATGLVVLAAALGVLLLSRRSRPVPHRVAVRRSRGRAPPP